MIDLLASAWTTIVRHRLRSLLAIAGVAVGVCALTSIMSVENSWRKAVAKFFASMDLQTVKVVHPALGDWRRLGFTRGELTPEDAHAIASSCSEAASVTFMDMWPSLLVQAEGYGLESPVRAVEANFCETLHDAPREGRLFTAEEDAARAPVCVLSYKTRLFLFGDEPAIGKDIRVGDYRMQVVGVITGRNHLGIGDDCVYVPSRWARAFSATRTSSGPEPQIYVRARSSTEEAHHQVDALLRKRLGGGKDQSFTESLWWVREQALHSRSRATLYSGLAALCALLAAGVGIAALLFVSVSERARDIGIMRALGATRGWIYAEQITTALLLSGMGAVVGALAGIPASAASIFATRWQPLLPQQSDLLGYHVAEFPKLSGLAVGVSWQAVVVAVTLAMLTGVVSALAPATEAAEIDPARAIARRPGARWRLREALTCIQVAFGVLVLVVLTSYFAMLQTQERAEARKRLGEDRLTAAADPVAARREPVEDRELKAYRDALASVITSPQDLARLRAQTPLLKDLTPLAPVCFDVAGGGQVAETVTVVFTTQDLLNYGRGLVVGDSAAIAAAFERGEPVAVLDPDLRSTLFGSQDPIGRRISIAGRKFTVMGVRQYASESFARGGAWVPVNFYADLQHEERRDEMANLFTRFSMTELESRPKDEQQYAAATVQLREALLPLLPKRYRGGIKFSEDVPATLREFLLQSKSVALRGAVGALAVLLVALIGLANMLLVSVHDELREIGLRRALGAVRPDIFLHFLSQGVLLSLAGAAAGLLAGAVACWVTRDWAGIPLAVSTFWAAAGAVATVLAGVLTSIIPAALAARIHPVEALRYE